jgi:hypothetical protein
MWASLVFDVDEDDVWQAIVWTEDDGLETDLHSAVQQG